MTERSFATTSEGISETPEEASTRCMLVILSFLNERGIAITDWTAFVAQRFALFWIDSTCHDTAFTALIQLQEETQPCVLHLQTCTDLDQDLRYQATLPTASWTVVSRSDLDDIFALFHLLAQKLCLRYKWERNANRITLSLARDIMRNDKHW